MFPLDSTTTPNKVTAYKCFPPGTPPLGILNVAKRVNSTGTTGTILKYGQLKRRSPARSSSKKPVVTGGSTTAITTIETTSKSQLQQRQQRRSKGVVVKADERRQPLSKPANGPKAKLPLRKGVRKINATSKLPRPKGATSAEGGGPSGGGGSGSGSSRVDASGGTASGEGISSPSKRPTPRWTQRADALVAWCVPVSTPLWPWLYLGHTPIEIPCGTRLDQGWFCVPHHARKPVPPSKAVAFLHMYGV